MQLNPKHAIEGELPSQSRGDRMSSRQSHTVVPCIPSAVRESATRIIQTLGSKFSRTVNQAFLAPLRRSWAGAFWETVREKWVDEDQVPKIQAANLGLHYQTWMKVRNSTDDDVLSLWMLLGTLLQTAKSWDDVPKLPRRIDVAISCYQSAIHCSQMLFNAKNGTVMLDREPARDEFEYLLSLYAHDLWFALHLELEKQTVRQRSSDVAKLKKDIANQARQITNEAEDRLSAINDGSVPQESREDRSRRLGTVQGLELLERRWGIGWLTAIQVIPYRWEV